MATKSPTVEAHLEPEPDPHAIHEAVRGERQRREDPDLGVMVVGELRLVGVVHQQHLLDDVEEQESDHERDHGAGGVGPGPVHLFDDLRQDVEAHHAEQHPRREAHHEMQPAPRPDAEKSTQRGRDKGHERPENRGHGATVVPGAVGRKGFLGGWAGSGATSPSPLPVAPGGKARVRAGFRLRSAIRRAGDTGMTTGVLRR